MAGSAAILLGSVAVLILVAERQEKEMLGNVAVLRQVEDAELALSWIHRIVADGGATTELPVAMNEYGRDLAAVREVVGRITPRSAEIDARLKATERRSAILFGTLRRMGTAPASRAQAHEVVDVMIVEINALSDALANRFRSPVRHGVWQGLYALVAASALLLVAWTAILVRILRTQRHLFAELRTLMESSSQVLVSIDAAGNPVRWNERLMRAAGVDADALRKLRITDLFDAVDAPAVVQAIDQALGSGSFECDLPLRTANGRTEYTWVFTRSGDEADSVLTISGRDISDRRAAERRLAETEARYRELFERMGDGAFISDGHRLIEVNAALADMLGRTREEMLAVDPLTLYACPEDRPLLWTAIEQEGGVSTHHLRLQHKDGSILECVVTASARLDEQGSFIGSQGLIRDVTEQRRLEESLVRSEAEYRGLFEHAHDAIMILDPVTRTVLDANLRACLLYDIPHGDFVGTCIDQLAVDVNQSKLELQGIPDDSSRSRHFESSQYRRDGSIVEVDSKATHVTYHGRPAILTINRDITSRKREERRVRESEERFRLLLENVVDYAIFMLDPSGCVVSWNEGAERLFGVPAAMALGRSFAMFYPPAEQTAEIPAAHLAEAVAIGRVEIEKPQMRGNGTMFEASIVLTRVVDELGQLRGFAQVTRDVTEKKQIEGTQNALFARIENVAQEWTRTFDAVGTPIILLDTEGRILRLNAAAAREAAQDVRAMIDRRVQDLPGEPWKTIASCADFYWSNGVIVDGRAEDKGTGRVWQVSLTAAELARERCLIAQVHDLTLVTKLEESLRRTEVTAALGALVAGVAHEVRNPLFTISATLDTCEARLASVPELLRYTTPLREEVSRLNELMQELLDYGKPHPLERADISLIDVVRAAIAQSRGAASYAVRIDLDCRCDAPIVDGDQGRLEQVIRNVIENSIQHGPPHESIQVNVREDGEDIVCEVLDRGRGFSADDLRRAFTPFYTRRKGGTGLGLGIARNIVNAHGGEITLSNREGGGAVVKLRFPRSPSVTTASAV